LFDLAKKTKWAELRLFVIQPTVMPFLPGQSNHAAVIRVCHHINSASMKKCVLFVFILAAFAVDAQSPDTVRYCITGEAVGVGGNDPVSYFTEGKAVLGKAEHRSEHEGVTYFFVNEKNKKMFLSSPEKYLPQFGGWCSMTLAMGRLTKPKYDNFLVANGKLYLFERTLSVNGKELWLLDPKKNEKLAKAAYEKKLSK
jgi:YHS domain-containing protein